ncbi:MAG TPA: UDP-N-acetylmuramoyl-L-alanine--D-glutamate ligase, partial [Nitrospinaceae bacterium]|nr:UDP-N-acetylmuramoyl-L-alanine--D-glutamate ligase [Nitrospinaceae bacterium]HIL26902.1 UDP-N-acetylmuramoyl-L-alanine--D-glutamate ligase [Nitrospinaceae bacterium]
MLLVNKNITVVGMGLTGIASANFLVSKKARVTLIDSKSRSKLEKNIRSLNPQIRTLFDCSKIPLNSELIVLSPGVNINSPFLVKANKQGVPVISEIELASRFTQTPIIAVTGTNGKSTVTTLIGDILKQTGKRVAVGGNLGRPFIDLLKIEHVDYFVLEVSTFQLEGINSFRPNIAIILNITPDHLDRHKNFKEYSDLKGKISAFQTDEDTLILNKDDEHVLKQAIHSKAKKVFFSMTQKVAKGAYLEGNCITTSFNEKEKYFLSVDGLRPPLKFQIENILGAIAV